jgi:hypothetical protein
MTVLDAVKTRAAADLSGLSIPRHVSGKANYPLAKQIMLESLTDDSAGGSRRSQARYLTFRVLGDLPGVQSVLAGGGVRINHDEFVDDLADLVTAQLKDRQE